MKQEKLLKLYRIFIVFMIFFDSLVDKYALGLKRAKATKDTMVQEGFVNPERIHLVSKGESEPVCQTHTKECDALNRRTEIVIYPLNK